MNRPLCIFCRKPVGPHKPSVCLSIVHIERDWKIVKGRAEVRRL